MIDAYEDPGTPDSRSGWRYLWWLVRRQPGRSAAGAVFASVWMVMLAAMPYTMARAVDRGVEPRDMGALAGWTGLLVLVGVCTAWLSIMRHRTMTRVRMDANFRTVKVVVGQAVRLGGALRHRVGAGEVVTIGVGDVQTISQTLTVVGPGVGAVVACAVVAGLLVSVSVQLAVVVLAGVPLLGVLVGPLLGRLQGREAEYRERQSVLTARIGDLAGGLRVLNGLGGKGLVADAFRRDSRRLSEQGYRVGAVTSWIQALGAGLPTLFLAGVTWLGARLAVRGEISVGELVSVYGYVVALLWPVAFLIEGSQQVSRGLVAAGRVVRFLRLEPEPDPGTRAAPAGPAVLHDPASGVRVPPGRLTALTGPRPADAAAVVDRLGRYTPSDATWGDVRLDEVPLAEVRRRILVADAEADLFAGALRHVIGAAEADPTGTGPVDPHPRHTSATGHDQRRPAGDETGPGGAGRVDLRLRRASANGHGHPHPTTDTTETGPRDTGRTDPRPRHTSATGRRGPVPAPRHAEADAEADLARAVRAAAADDIVRGLPDGLDSPIDAQGRNLSGGQRQRIRLARALLADPEVLLAVEPTSALDAHTEATVADRLRDARQGRTTVVTCTSPLVLDRADLVHHLVDGKVVATGTHRELLDTEPGYRALVARDADAEEAVG
ncbi:ABC transporter transmembrane domain-containing protein [Streptomyces sp. HMX87]|uniref:ABC transporter transmembrane domain-containing protein n=1 Tax=Streptomyces sp. HMX87 TaxID=3390849 RepID=UPI003A886E35